MAPTPDAAATAQARSFDAVYKEWFRRVVRWLPAMGVPRGDVEDVAQEIFVTAQRQLASFRGDELSSWLYAIALRTASNHRRLAWFRRVLLVGDDDEPVASAGPTPETNVEQAQRLAFADKVLAGMSDKTRRAFMLFEVEGYSGEEIAALEGIPLATAWTRVHNARKEFAARREKLEKRGTR